MHDERTKPALTLPKKLAFTAIRIAVAGTVACSGETQQAPADAAADVAAVDAAPDVAAVDAAADATPDAVVADSAADAPIDVAVADAPMEACASPAYYCGGSPSDPDAGPCPGLICTLPECPPGCVPEPIA